MELLFDRGTLLLKIRPDNGFGVRTTGLQISSLPGILWDERVQAFRAPGFRYKEIKFQLDRVRYPYKNLVVDNSPLDGSWEAVPLRPYQEMALRSWSAADRRGIVALPTGSGKTRVAVAAMAELKRKTLCLVPTRILLEQWQNELKKHFSGKIGVYGDGLRELAPITVATFESAYRNMARFGYYFEFIVVDECHHFGNGMRDETLEMAVAPARLGLTATLPQEEAVLAKLNQLVGKPVYSLNIGDLTGKFLAPFELISIRLDLNPRERKVYDRDIKIFKDFYCHFITNHSNINWDCFARYASRSAEGRLALSSLCRARQTLTFTESKAQMLEALLLQHQDRKVLIFTADAQSAYVISKKHLVMALTSDIKRRERDEMLQRFKDNDIKTIVSCRVLNEGIDVPDADVAIIVGGTRGEREHVQRIGRLLRPSANKKALIYELVCRNTLEVKQSNKRSRNLDSRIAY